MSVTRALVHQTDATKKMATVQVEGHADEVMDGVESWEPAGITHRPPDPNAGRGAEAVVFAVDGASDHRIAMVADRRNRPTNLASGDTTLYDAHGNRLDLTTTGAALNCDLDADGTVDAADGFVKGGVPGLSGTFTFTNTDGGVTVGVYVLTFKGGILTDAQSTPPGAWVPEV